MAPSMGVEALDTNYDARKYTICAPWYGERHPKFRLWQQAYIAGVADEGDDDAGLDQTLRGTDPGGPLWPAALAAAAAGNPPPAHGAAAQSRRNKRLRKAYKLLYKHVENEEIRTRFVNEGENDGRACWAILEEECAAPEDEMITTELKTTISNATILGVAGHQEDSITRFARWINHTNGKITPVADRVSEHDLCVKILTSISTASPHLKLEADKELKATS